ncbi:hypothetical protein B0H19DRAFT_1123499 [Mycena capillaripes]|nr:hypothetical protein B0H19DRAFT_1123499 [Mycena capillaripes]
MHISVECPESTCVSASMGARSVVFSLSFPPSHPFNRRPPSARIPPFILPSLSTIFMTFLNFLSSITPNPSTRRHN